MTKHPPEPSTKTREAINGVFPAKIMRHARRLYVAIPAAYIHYYDLTPGDRIEIQFLSIRRRQPGER